MQSEICLRNSTTFLIINICIANIAQSRESVNGSFYIKGIILYNSVHGASYSGGIVQW